MRLRGHAAADGNDQVGVLLLEVLILPDDGECALFGVLADGAGVDGDERGTVRLVADLVAHCARQTPQFFAVCLVLLAAKGQDECARTCAACLCFRVVVRPHRPDVPLLRVDLLRWEDVSLFHVSFCSSFLFRCRFFYSYYTPISPKSQENLFVTRLSLWRGKMKGGEKTLGRCPKPRLGNFLKRSNAALLTGCFATSHP